MIIVGLAQVSVALPAPQLWSATATAACPWEITLSKWVPFATPVGRSVGRSTPSWESRKTPVPASGQYLSGDCIQRRAATRRFIGRLFIMRLVFAGEAPNTVNHSISTLAATSKHCITACPFLIGKNLEEEKKIHEQGTIIMAAKNYWNGFKSIIQSRHASAQTYVQ